MMPVAAEWWLRPVMSAHAPGCRAKSCGSGYTAAPRLRAFEWSATGRRRQTCCTARIQCRRARSARHLARPSALRRLRELRFVQVENRSADAPLELEIRLRQHKRRARLFWCGPRVSGLVVLSEGAAQSAQRGQPADQGPDHKKCRGGQRRSSSRVATPENTVYYSNVDEVDCN